MPMERERYPADWERIALATFTGSCAAPAGIRAENYGAVKGMFVPRVAGDTLYLEFKSGGTTFILR